MNPCEYDPPIYFNTKIYKNIKYFIKKGTWNQKYIFDFSIYKDFLALISDQKHCVNDIIIACMLDENFHCNESEIAKIVPFILKYNNSIYAEDSLISKYKLD